MGKLKVIIISFIFLTLCSNLAYGTSAAALNLPPSNLITVPMTRQATDYTCGVAALQSILEYYGDEILETTLAKILKATPEAGTSYLAIAKYAKEKRYKVSSYQNMTLEMLQQMLDKHLPVLLAIQAWPDHPVDYKTDWDDGHWVLAIGYDQKNIYFMDPSTLGNYTYIPIPEFLDRWHDIDSDSVTKLIHFGMLITKEKPTYDPKAILYLE